MLCAFCERDLICESCQAPYEPPTAQAYAALSEREVAISCPACEEVLTCHWCKTPYLGSDPDDDDPG